MRMIARACHPESPEVLAKDEVCESASKLPPVFPKAPPIVRIDGRCSVKCPVLQKSCQPEEQTLGGGPVVTKQLKFRSLGKYQKRNLVEFVTQSDSERLEKGFLHPMNERCLMQLIRFPLHSDTGGCLDQGIDRPSWQPPKRCATAARMGNWRMVLEQINFALQVNLYDLSIDCRPCKMAGPAFTKEQVKDDPIKGRVLRMPMTIPV
jgi:hypothetical protein